MLAQVRPRPGLPLWVLLLLEGLRLARELRAAGGVPAFLFEGARAFEGCPSAELVCPQLGCPEPVCPEPAAVPEVELATPAPVVLGLCGLVFGALVVGIGWCWKCHRRRDGAAVGGGPTPWRRRGGGVLA